MKILQPKPKLYCVLAIVYCGFYCQLGLPVVLVNLYQRGHFVMLIIEVPDVFIS